MAVLSSNIREEIIGREKEVPMITNSNPAYFARVMDC
jgi:hypothetical protein